VAELPPSDRAEPGVGGRGQLRTRRYTPGPVRTNVETLEGNKVKVSVEVDEQEFEKALDAAFRKISREVRIPGFRPGKVPRRVLEAKIGSDVARQEALRDSLPDYYARAVQDNLIDVIAPPEIDITAGEEAGGVTFDAVVEVRPRITVPGYGNLRVTVPSPAVADEEVDAQIDRLRDQSGELRTVERPARDGDHASIDIQGSVAGEPMPGLTADDYLYEVGSASVVPEVDGELRGAKVGDILQFTAAHPDPDEGEITFRVLVKEIKEKVLPEPSDEWANEVSEFDTLAELRDDILNRLSAIKRVQAQLALRQNVVDALIELVDIDAPEPLVAGEVERRAHDLVHRLQAQGASVEQYLEATGRTAEELTGELRERAAEAVKADLALRAVAEAEGIEPGDSDVDAEIARLAERADVKAAELRRQLERAEQLQAVRSDLKKTQALEWLVEHCEIVDEQGNPVDRSALQPPPPSDEAGTGEPEETTT
jgi:trigger factor